MSLHLARTHALQHDVDIEAVKKVFPYGQLLPIEFQAGGMRASSGIELPEMGGKHVKNYSRRESGQQAQFNGPTFHNIYIFLISLLHQLMLVGTHIGLFGRRHNIVHRRAPSKARGKSNAVGDMVMSFSFPSASISAVQRKKTALETKKIGVQGTPVLMCTSSTSFLV